MRLCAIVSMLAVVLSLAGLSLAGDGSPKRSDEAETAKKPPQFEATDWTQRPDLADARAGGCAGRVRKGAVTVSSTDGEVEYEHLGFRWGDIEGAFEKPQTSLDGKNGKTIRGGGVEEHVRVTERGFETEVVFSASGGPGDLVLRGRIGTALEIEKAFPAEWEATEFETDGAICLVNRTGRRAIAIGATTAYDASGQSWLCTVAYRQVAGGYEFDTTVPADWLSSAEFPVRVDPLIGTPAAVMTTTTPNESASACAFGSGKYMITYTANVNGNDIQATLINADGTPGSTAFTVATGTSAQTASKVAWVPAGGGVFAVVHKDGNNVWIRRFNAAGTLIGSARVNNLPTTNRANDPEIVSDGVGTFLVTWSGALSTPGIYEIWAELRDAQGAILKDDVKIAGATGTIDLADPDTAWNATRGEWFFAWERYDGAVSGSDRSLRATAWNAGLTAATMGEVTLSTTAGSQDDPAAAWNELDDRYAVAWTQRVSNVRTVRMNVFDADTGGPAGAEIALESSSQQSRMADLGFSAGAGRYVVLFDQYSGSAGGTYGRGVKRDLGFVPGVFSATGVEANPIFTLSDDTGISETASALARNAGADEWLASWTDGAGTATDIWQVRLDMTPPAAPGPVTTSNTASTVTLQWPKGAEPDLQDYAVFRATAEGGPYAWVATVALPGGATVSWTDTSVTPNVRYWYRVRSQDTHGNPSDDSVAVSEAIDTVAPGAPTGVAAAPQNRSALVTWAANPEPDVTGYNVWYRLTGGGSWTKHTPTPVPGTSWTVTGLTNGLGYDFAVTALDAEPNESALSTVATGTPIYTAPAGLTLDGTTATTATMHWTASSEPDLAGYRAYRGPGAGGPWTLMTPTLVTGTSWTDTGLPAGTWFWVVRAVATGGDESGNSNVISASVSGPLPPAPTIDPSNARKTNDTTPKITGTANAGFLVKIWSGSMLLGSGNANGSGAFEISSTVTLAEGAHGVTATQEDGVGGPASPPASPVVVTVDITAPAPVKNLISVGGSGWVDVQWQGGGEADLLGYDVFRSDAGGPFVKLNTNPVLESRYVDRSVTNGVSYQYRVVAVDDTKDED